MVLKASRTNEEVLERWERWRSEVVFVVFCFCLSVYFGMIFKIFLLGVAAGVRGGYGELRGEPN